MWNKRVGHVIRIHSLHDTSELPDDTRTQFLQRWNAPGPPHRVVPTFDRNLNEALCLATITDESADLHVTAEVQRLLQFADRYTKELAALASISTWQVNDNTIAAIVQGHSG